MSDKSKTDILITIRRELNKEHLEYDGNNRISKKFIAPYDAIDGDVCFVIEYLYYGLTLFVKGRKEGHGVWLTSYDDTAFLVDDLSNQLIDDLGNELIGA
jgi:hypothetical protein